LLMRLDEGKDTTGRTLVVVERIGGSIEGDSRTIDSAFNILLKEASTLQCFSVTPMIQSRSHT
jgi:hypothetical protein